MYSDCIKVRHMSHQRMFSILILLILDYGFVPATKKFKFSMIKSRSQ